MRTIGVDSFDSWRETARELLAARIPPGEVYWVDGQTPSLFSSVPAAPPIKEASRVPVPPRFLELGRMVAAYRYEARWSLLYKTLWRITHGEHDLLELHTDDDVRHLWLMEKAIRREIHKTHAFVRFRQVDDAQGESFVAWYEPAHNVLPLAAPFFQKRFGSMRWAILTPDRSVRWDLEKLIWGPGVSRDHAPQADAMEEIWKTYYRSIFNPARVKVKAMKKEMPVRFWPNMPETLLIPELLQSAGSRVDAMRAAQPASAASVIPDQATWPELKSAAAACAACPLANEHVQTVFGEGPFDAKIVLVGEAPGDHEDRQGKPFVGPAGELLNRALMLAGLDRAQLYLTNAVKHFKFEQVGQRRIHKKPSGREIHACRPWLEVELGLLQPQAVVCLGATAAQSVMGRVVRIREERGQWQPDARYGKVLVTTHPASILRTPDLEQQKQEFELFVEELKLLKTLDPLREEKSSGGLR